MEQGFYNKAPGEDLVSIVTGITQNKGRVHITVCPAVTITDIEPYRDLPQADFFHQVAKLVNERVYQGYRLYGINYAACDRLRGTTEFMEHYSEEDITLLDSREKLLPDSDDQTSTALRDLLRRLYANPVLNRMNMTL